MAYLIAPGVPGPLKSCSASKNTPGDLSTSKKFNFFDFFNFFFSFLLINLSQTAYFDDLSLPACRKLNLESAGINIISIRAIGCSCIPGEGAI